MQDVSNTYLRRYAWPGPLIDCPPAENTGIIVIIPVYNEPDLEKTILSLVQCAPAPCATEVIFVVNHPENSDEKIIQQSTSSVQLIEAWQQKSIHLTIHLIKAFDLPQKTAGVGLARKIGMDEAIRRFEYLNNKRGILVCLDSDCTCKSNYLTELHRHFEDTNINGCSVYYEHPVESPVGNQDSENEKISQSITVYELHLRYYVRAMKYAGFPFAYHTVGSSMAVTSDAYQKQGGMNKRKAGEDFYFLNNIFQLGGFVPIYSTTVYPSPRVSDRVPFGTGIAVKKIKDQDPDAYESYNPEIFDDFKVLNAGIHDLWHSDDIFSVIKTWPESVQGYAVQIDFAGQVTRIKQNTSEQETFRKAFYRWFDAFKSLKFVHFARDHYYPNIRIGQAASLLLQKSGLAPAISNKELLFQYRELERQFE